MFIKQIKIFFIAIFLIVSVVYANDNLHTLYTTAGGKVKTLDPILADDFASRDVVSSFYDTLLQYNYDKRPYTLECSMLSKLPIYNKEQKSYHFILRDDLYFIKDKSLENKNRKISSKDVIYSILRLADGRNHSSVYWMLKGKIKGLDKFREDSLKLPKGDNSIYNSSIEGFEILDDREFVIKLTQFDPRFLYVLAMPNLGVVSKDAVEYYGDDFFRNPVGSGAFTLKKWIIDYRLELLKNPSYRKEYYPNAENKSDRTKNLPLLDRIICYQIKQPMSAWLMFLQGKLDLNLVDRENVDLFAMSGGKLPKSLANRGIKLLRMPEFEVRYVGFNFADEKLGKNLKLRQALSLAYNIQRRVEHANYQLIPAQGPIPPGVAGYDKDFRNKFVTNDLTLAKKLLSQAGYPNGIDPKTKKPLELTFDQAGHNSMYRQLGELAVVDFAKIGVKIVPILNNNPRFFEKLRQGKTQLFRLSWVGDYPDAENFLQLFYSKNINSSNRVGFSDLKFDKMFEKALEMHDTPERTAIYKEMVKYLSTQVPWIFEGFPISYQLNHQWLENYKLHDFAFSRWKYLSLNPEKRDNVRSNFKPLSFKELSKQ